MRWSVASSPSARSRPRTGGRFRRLLVEHRAIDSAYEKATEVAEQAKQQLAAFPPSPERDALMALPDFVLSRDR